MLFKREEKERGQEREGKERGKNEKGGRGEEEVSSRNFQLFWAFIIEAE